MDPRAGFDPLVASVTFSGSLISFLATTAVLASYVYYREEQRSFRHALVFNLALAEFINTLNNTLSGIMYLRDHALYPGTACTINGFVGQLSVQASDFSILVIALVTLLTITRTTYLPDASGARKIAICMSVWVIPITTACIATGLGTMGPVSGNWCWISSTRTDLRYALTHGWRIAIIFCTAGIYLFVWWYMKRHFRSLVSTVGSVTTSTGGSQLSWKRRRKGFKKMKGEREGAHGGGDEGAVEDTELSTMSKSRISRIGDDWELSAPEAAYMDHDADTPLEHEQGQAERNASGRNRRRRRGSSMSSTSDEDDYDYEHDRDSQSQQKSYFADSRRAYYNENGEAQPLPPLPPVPASPDRSKPVGVTTSATVASEFPVRRRTRQMEREIKRMLLLNAYPIMYVLLWIPGLANRFMEATGHKSNSRVLAALQASSQFVGLANALTYGFNKALRKKVKGWWSFRGKR